MKVDAVLLGKQYIFETKPGLFSKDKIDSGTQLLIEHMSINKTDSVLDLGCGYGVIGLVAADLASKGIVYMVDTDIRAIKYSKINAKLNNINNVEIIPSDGFDELKGITFDVILSNPPSHTPKETIRELLNGAREQLNPNGKLFFVVERRIKPMYKREVEKAFGDYEEISSGANHVVLLAFNKYIIKTGLKE